jgi:S-adenosylmethionine hydrolase
MKTIITLMTDFGSEDGYAGALKGRILSINPEARLHDIGHEIPPFNIAHGAYALRTYFFEYPEKTVHIAVVDPGVGSNRDGLVIRCDGRWFVGPDNGLADLILYDRTYEAFKIRTKAVSPHLVSQTFHGRDIFAPVAAALSLGQFHRDWFEPFTYKPRQARIDLDTGRIPLLCADHFGNLIFNLHHSELVGKKILKLSYKNFSTTLICPYFSAVEQGQPLFLWNSAGFLELAVNQGSAADYFNPVESEVLLSTECDEV